MNYDKGDQCPLCKVELGDSWRERDGRLIFGSRRIGIYDRDQDRTVAWKCPDCNGEWPRTEGPITGFRKTQ